MRRTINHLKIFWLASNRGELHLTLAGIVRLIIVGIIRNAVMRRVLDYPQQPVVVSNLLRREKPRVEPISTETTSAGKP